MISMSRVDRFKKLIDLKEQFNAPGLKFALGKTLHDIQVIIARGLLDTRHDVR